MSDGMSYPEEVPLGRPMEGYIDKSLVYGEGPSLQDLRQAASAPPPVLRANPPAALFEDAKYEAEKGAWVASQSQWRARQPIVLGERDEARILSEALSHIGLGLEALEELLRGMVLHEAGDNYRRQQEMLKLLASMRGD